MDDWPDFHGPNAGYVLELYDRFRQNPESVDAATQAYFTTGSPRGELPSGSSRAAKWP